MERGRSPNKECQRPPTQSQSNLHNKEAHGGKEEDMGDMMSIHMQDSMSMPCDLLLDLGGDVLLGLIANSIYHVPPGVLHGLMMPISLSRLAT